MIDLNQVNNINSQKEAADDLAKYKAYCVSKLGQAFSDSGSVRDPQVLSAINRIYGASNMVEVENIAQYALNTNALPGFPENNTESGEINRKATISYGMTTQRNHLEEQNNVPDIKDTKFDSLGGTNNSPVVAGVSAGVTNAAGPADTQQNADFFSALSKAKEAAQAGNPEPLRNFDKFFNITDRPQAEYYPNSTPQASLLNGGNVPSMPVAVQVATAQPAAAPVPVQTQQEADFYAAAAKAIDAAKAGNPEPLRNFDKFFNITRPEAEYSASFYATPAPVAAPTPVLDTPMAVALPQAVALPSTFPTPGMGGGPVNPSIGFGGLPQVQQPISSDYNPDPGFSPSGRPAVGVNAKPGYGGQQVSTPIQRNLNGFGGALPQTYQAQVRPQTEVGMQYQPPGTNKPKNNNMAGTNKPKNNNMAGALPVNDWEQRNAAAMADARAALARDKEYSLKNTTSARNAWTSGASQTHGSESMVVPPITPASQAPPAPL